MCSLHQLSVLYGNIELKMKLSLMHISLCKLLNDTVRKRDLRGLACLLKISQWANLNVFNVSVTCLTGAQKGGGRDRTVVLIEKKNSDEKSKG